MGLRYWVCQECKFGHVNETKPAKCPECLTVGGKWKSSDTANMKSFKTYICMDCRLRTVEERQPPDYACDHCHGKNWKIFNGYENM